MSYANRAGGNEILTENELRVIEDERKQLDKATKAYRAALRDWERADLGSANMPKVRARVVRLAREIEDCEKKMAEILDGKAA